MILVLLTLNLVESCPGYPQFCNLVGEHPTFSVSRRFSVVRARLLFSKQYRVVALEKQLQELDLQQPPEEQYLGSFDADANATRLQVLKDLDEALADYGKPCARIPPLLFSPDEEAGYETSVGCEDFYKHEDADLTQARWTNEAKY